jgi:signal transduction histidine kinase
MTSLSTAALRRLLPALVLLTVAQMAVSFWFSLTSDQDNDPVLELTAVGLIGSSFAGTGLFAWWRRPANLVGPLMFLTGFCWFFNLWLLSNAEGPFALGYVAQTLSYGFLVHLLLVFPDGKLETRGDRAIVVGAYLVVSVMQAISALLIQPDRVGCENCPDNPILITGSEVPYDIYNAVQGAVGIAVLIGLVVTLVRRWRAWPPSRRRQFAPVLYAGGSCLALISLLIAVGVVGVSRSAEQAIFFAALIPLAVIPFAFLAGLLRGRISRAEAVAALVSQPSFEGDLRDAIAEALTDDSVELAYWVPEADGYVDAAGVRVKLPADTDDRQWIEVTHEGRRVGAIVHAGGPDETGELVGAVASAAGIRMENERLDAELRARLEELRASRARIVEAGYRERRRVERDLHDGAQQRLLALALNLKLARSRIETDPAEAGELLDEATTELEGATAELRELARGIHPGLLTDRGLVPALEALASRSPVPVELSTEVPERPPAGIEAAAYFLVSESLANVAKHAGAKHAGVSVSRSNGALTVEVSDDGRGGADRSGSGLQGLADRIAAVDGEFTVSDRDAGGTVVRARIPLG